ncbi:hypothetical protein PBCV1_a506R [Paramecium bursaria Chlorella virus 1]|uniref:Uncharacterized protein n=1 Tax=Paramecium bursaria Chlorella virus 1 TaxID=10506 RepID=Q98556_PBCV1|nr:hypothetical protein PBCV1_a506R [Paramecium bursaria Chlorella virus 1]AAC96873.1 hypothetical protein [Paramecium bursaria Chlorella virus 1]
MSVLIKKSSNFSFLRNQSSVSLLYSILQGNNRLAISLPVCLVSVKPKVDTPHDLRCVCVIMNSSHLNTKL